MELNDNRNEINLEWVPLERIGPFIFGSMIDKYCEKYELNLSPEEYNEKVGWEVYKGGDDIRIYLEMGRIESVSCSATFNYQGINIIGKPVDKAIDLINRKPDNIEIEELFEGPQEVYNFDPVGLQVWVKNGLVVTVICSGPYGED